MGIKSNVHEVVVSIVKTTYTELETGTEIKLMIRVACSEFCDFRGKKIILIDKSAVVQEIELTKFNGAESETDEIVVKTSIEPGEYAWTAVFPEQEEGGVLHEQGSTSFSFIFNPHSISMAVWDIPVTVQLNTAFKVKVGIKCSAECNLTGNKIEIYDQEGDKASTEKLGGIPWPGTSALYWTEVELKAPNTEGNYTWQAKFTKPDIEIPHLETGSSFGFKVVNPPECTVTVEVIDKDEQTSIKDAYVILHPYRTKTDESGIARLEVAKGGYQLYVTGEDKYEIFETTVLVTDNLTIKAELIVPPVMEGDF